MMKNILVVTGNARTREAIGDELERCGLQVMVCPGPQAPDFVCVAQTCDGCALATAADGVILDCALGGDTTQTNATSARLIGFYRAQGLPVVAIDDADGGVGPWAGDVARLPHMTPPDDIVGAAVFAIMQARSPEGGSRS